VGTNKQRRQNSLAVRISERARRGISGNPVTGTPDETNYINNQRLELRFLWHALCNKNKQPRTSVVSQ
jgi:hypothetical protein